jgi:hypothetical protein
MITLWDNAASVNSIKDSMKRLRASCVLIALLLVACPIQSQDGLTVAHTTIPSYSWERTAIALTGTETTTARITLGYDPSILDIAGLESAAALLDTAYIDSATVTITLADTVPMAGMLAYLTLRAVVEVDTFTTLTVQNVTLDSGQVALHDGVITIRPYSGRDVTLDGQVTMADVMAIYLAARWMPHQIAQLHPRWWLERANVHENYLDNGYPLVDLLDVVALLRTDI